MPHATPRAHATDSNLARNVTLPTPVIAVQPTVTIGAVSQNGFLRPRGGLHQGASNPDTVASFKVGHLALCWRCALWGCYRMLCPACQSRACNCMGGFLVEQQRSPH